MTREFDNRIVIRMATLLFFRQFKFPVHFILSLLLFLLLEHLFVAKLGGGESAFDVDANELKKVGA